MSTDKTQDAGTVTRYRTIRREMFNRGVTMRAVGRRLGVGHPTVTLVAQGKRVSRRVRRALARAVGMKYEELWG